MRGASFASVLVRLEDAADQLLTFLSDRIFVLNRPGGAAAVSGSGWREALGVPVVAAPGRERALYNSAAVCAHLERARGSAAAAAVTAASAAEHCLQEVVAPASQAAEALSLLAETLAAVALSDCNMDMLAELNQTASEGFGLVMDVARACTQVQHLCVRRMADSARQAAAEGRLVATFHAASKAAQHAALAAWVTSVGGPVLVHELRVAQAEAEAVAKAVGDFDAEVLVTAEAAWVASQRRQQAVAVMKRASTATKGAWEAAAASGGGSTGSSSCCDSTGVAAAAGAGGPSACVPLQPAGGASSSSGPSASPKVEAGLVATTAVGPSCAASAAAAAAASVGGAVAVGVVTNARADPASAAAAAAGAGKGSGRGATAAAVGGDAPQSGPATVGDAAAAASGKQGKRQQQASCSPSTGGSEIGSSLAPAGPVFPPAAAASGSAAAAPAPAAASAVRSAKPLLPPRRPVRPPLLRPEYLMPQPALLDTVMAGAADHITEAGELPEAARKVMTNAANQLVQYSRDQDNRVITGSVWEEVYVPVQLLQLLSLAVRHLADSPAVGPDGQRPSEEWAAWESTFLVVTHCVLFMGHIGLQAAVTNPFIEVIIRIDLIPCWSKLLAASAAAAAAAATAAAAAAGAGGSGSVMHRGGAGRSGGGVPTREVRARWAVVNTVCVMVSDFVRRAVASPVYELSAMHLKLQEALLSSGVVEHAARAALLMLAPAAGGEQDPPNQIHPHNSCLFVIFVAIELQQAIFSKASGRARLTGFARQLLSSSPSLNHLLLSHVVSRLCAARPHNGPGQPDHYGLPASARVLVLDDADAYGSQGREQWQQRHRQRQQHEQQGRGPGPFTRYSLAALSLWTQLGVWPRCGRRGLADLCMRLVGARAPGDRDGDWPLKTYIEHRTQAAACALALASEHGGVDGANDVCSRLWVPLVELAKVATKAGVCEGSASFKYTSTTPQALLVSLPPPPLLALPGDTPLPLDPPPSIAAAVASGYIPCLEHLLRANTGRSTLAAATPLLHVMGHGLQLTGIFAYGDGRHLAHLVSTSAKVLRVVTEIRPQNRNSDRAHMIRVGCCVRSKMLVAFKECGGLGAGAQPGEEGQWWLRSREAGTAAAAEAGSACGSTGSCSGTGCQSEAGGSSNSSSEPTQPRLTPFRQLQVLCSWGLSRWLPVVIQAVRSYFEDRQYCRGAGLSGSITVYPEAFLGVALGWVLPAVLAYLDCQQATEEKAGVEGPGGGSCGGDAAQGERAAASSSSGNSDNNIQATAANVAADSWLRLLMLDARVLELLLLAAQDFHRKMEVDVGIEVAVLHNALEELLAALLPVMVVFPARARKVLLAPITLDQPQNIGGYINTIMVDSFPLLDRDLRDGWNSWAQYTMGNRQWMHVEEEEAARVAWLRGMAGRREGGWAARVSALLPPPCVAAALLGVRACSNPGCTNLKGASEAEAPLSKCGGCSGSVAAVQWPAAYCSRECQRCHWKDGHKAECPQQHPKSKPP